RSLAADVHKLDEKVERFSVEEFASGTAEMKKLSAALDTAVLELKEMSSRLPGQFGSIVDAAQREHAEHLQSAIARLSTDLSHVLVTDATKNLDESTSRIIREIRSIQQMLQSGSGDGRAQILDSVRIQKQLEHIAAELTRVPKWRL